MRSFFRAMACGGILLIGMIGLFAACDGTAGECPNDLPASCPMPAPSFRSEVFPIVEQRCYPCHGPGGVEQAAHDYTTYQTIYAERRQILNQVYACKMPPAGSPAPTSGERAALLGWLVCGAPAN